MTRNASARLRLPRLVEDDPRAEAVERALDANVRALWSAETLETSVVALSDELVRVLKSAQMARRLTRGLERADKKLEAEARGMEQVDRRVEAVRGQRVSRLLLITDDAAERMCRRVETLAQRHKGRLLVLRLEATEDELGSLLFGSGQVAKLLLLDHKDAVADALLALAPDELEQDEGPAG